MAFRGKSRGGVSGRAVARELVEEIKRGLAPGLTVLTGDALYHLDRAQRAILDHLAPGEDAGFGLTVYSDGKLDPADLVAAARSLPMFATRRVLFVRDVAILAGEPDALVEFAKHPPRSSFILVRALKLDLRRPLHKALASAGKLLTFSAADSGTDAAADVREMAEERGLVLEGAVTALLLDASAGDLHRVASELDKLAAWLRGAASSKVTLAVAREVGAGGGLLTGWEVADAVMKRDPRAAVLSLRRLLDAGEEPLKILGGLAWRVRTLLHAKGLRAGGASKDVIAREVRVWSEPFHNSIAGFPVDELLSFPSLLLDADRSLKSRGVDPRSVLESLVRDLTQARAGLS